MSDSPGTNLDQILAEEDFIRNLASSLLRTADQAEDVVQHTMLQAGRVRDRTRLRPYLARTVRNKVIDHRRQEARIQKSERAAARPESVPSAGEIAERIELRERIARSVLSLPEHYQSTVWMRFFEDRQPREIAAALDVPVATVRTRIRRALEHLRRELQQSYGESWSTVLLWLHDGSPGDPPPPPPAGGPFSPLPWALVLGLCGAALWGLSPDGPVDPTATGRSTRSVAAAPDPAEGFDFLLGEWEMRPRIREPDGSWFDLPPAISRVRRSADGSSILDTWDSHGEDGVMMRTYDPVDGVWRVFWTSEGQSQGRMQVWEGGFVDGVGRFVGGGLLPGPAAPEGLQTRIVFRPQGPDRIEWSMDRSQDGGVTWESIQEREYRRR